MNRLALLFTVFSLLAAVDSFAQNGKKDIKPQVEADMFDSQMAAYHSALKYYDIQSGIAMIYSAMAIRPERTDLKDTLAYLYFTANQYNQANLVAGEIQKADPKRLDMLEICAVSKQNLGATKEALADYEGLYRETKSVQVLYRIVTLQYELKRFGEAGESIKQIIQSPEAEKQEVPITMPNNQTQTVPLKAAAYNIAGIMASQVNNTSEAKQFFEEALKLFPDFVLAKNNLKSLQEQSSKSSK